MFCIFRSFCLYCRNVSQILSASMNQKLSSSGCNVNSLANGNSRVKNSSASSTAINSFHISDAVNTAKSVTSLTTARKFICADCQKSVSTHRNLQRHRMSCKSALSSSTKQRQFCSSPSASRVSLYISQTIFN